MLDRQSGILKSGAMAGEFKGTGDTPVYGKFGKAPRNVQANSGGASRFFYTAKAGQAERNENLSDSNSHPTVKPIRVIQYLIRLVLPPGGIVLDPFLGSGTLMKAARGLNVDWLGIEMNPEYVEIAKGRISGELF